MQKIHVKPNNNWMNDPNGFIYYQVHTIYFISASHIMPDGEECIGTM